MVDSQYYKIFGANLKQLRESCGQTRERFAMDCNCAKNTIQNYELGRSGPVYKQFLLICNGKGVSPNQLLDGLLPANSERDTIRELNTILDGLSNIDRQRLSNLLNISIDCRLNTVPHFKGASLGTRVQLLRINAGIEVEKMAALCMIAKSTLQGYESGQYDPSVPVLLRICDILSVSPEYLMVSELKHTDCKDDRLLNLFPSEIKMICAVRGMSYRISK